MTTQAQDRRHAWDSRNYDWYLLKGGEVVFGPVRGISQADRDALSRLFDEQGQQWQPIETAPKDRTPVLVYQPMTQWARNARQRSQVDIAHWHIPGNPQMPGYWIGTLNHGAAPNSLDATARAAHRRGDGGVAP